MIIAQYTNMRIQRDQKLTPWQAYSVKFTLYHTLGITFKSFVAERDISIRSVWDICNNYWSCWNKENNKKMYDTIDHNVKIYRNHSKCIVFLTTLGFKMVKTAFIATSYISYLLFHHYEIIMW